MLILNDEQKDIYLTYNTYELVSNWYYIHSGLLYK